MQRFEHGGDIYNNKDIVYDYSVNTSPLGMPPSAAKHLREALEQATKYPDTHCLQLTHTFASHYGINPENVLFGNGAADLIFRICAYHRPKVALTLAPSFAEYERSVAVFGGKMKLHALNPNNGFVLSYDVLDDLTPDVDVFFLCNPNNPTGKLIDDILLNCIIDRCAKMGILLILDECFIEFTTAPSKRLDSQTNPHLIVLGAFTKFYCMAGLRLGYLTATAQMCDILKTYGAEWSVSSLAQAAGVGALKEADWYERTLSLIDTERQYLHDNLKTLGFQIFLSDANFILIKTPLKLYDPLLNRGILIRRCQNFHNLDDTYYRLAVKERNANQILINHLKEIVHG